MKLQLPRANFKARRRKRRRRKKGDRAIARSSKPFVLSAHHQLLWALVGLLLTIGGTLVEAFVTNSPWNWHARGIQPQSLGVTWQIVAGLLVGCVGGKKAGALSQLAYIILGLTGLFPVFTQGGGWSYLLEPTFGYILGFIPGAWLCGLLAFRYKLTVESLAFSSIVGLLAIHGFGIVYLLGLHLLGSPGNESTFLTQSILEYSVNPFPAQLALVCAIASLAYLLRQILFY
ncbi:MAG: biotin transporter BioY [Cyanobacteriota bacterium]|nr:biotin transporter BioY [Cyanobacteriota bacterium]